jgi:hypothetical protein
VKQYGFFLLLLLSAPALLAQKVELGGGLGVLHYKGDISPNFHPAFARPGGNLFFRYNASQALSLRVQGMLGQFGADDKRVNDPFNQARGRSFRTRVSEISADLEYNFLNYKHENLKKAGNWTPYVFGGVGLMRFKPNVFPSASYRQSGLVLPFGAGIKWQLRSPWSLSLEFGMRKTFTDYLDNLGPDSDKDNPKAQGDNTHKDYYYYTGLSLSYTFYRIWCPE